MPEQIASSVAQMESWGFKIKTGSTVGIRDFTFGGTAQQRAADMQAMLDDPEVKAIMCGRGGYGAVQMIDMLDFTAFAKRPKWIIGFSDITLIHCHLNRLFHTASIHSKMCNSFPKDWALAEPIQVETILSIKRALTGEQMIYNAPYNESNRLGSASGELIGGNVSMIYSVAGSRSDILTKNKILFLEDTGEYLYSIDRMLYNMKRSGKFDQLAGLVIGGFNVKKEEDPDSAFGHTVPDLVLKQVAGLNFPVAFDFPVGHQKANFALKCGIMHRLSVTQDGTVLESI